MSKEQELIVINNEAMPVESHFGHYVKQSRICPVCQNDSSKEINLRRARDHKPIKDIAVEFGISPKELKKHFENHYIISDNNQEIINVLESVDSEKKEIITKALEGNLDIIEGTSSILKSQAKRLAGVQQRIKVLSDELERDMLEEEERKEFIDLNRLAASIEESMLKSYKTIDKKLFPPDKDDLYNAILDFKLRVLGKLADEIIIEMNTFSKKGPEYERIMEELKQALSVRFNNIEDSVMRSGGIIKKD